MTLRLKKCLDDYTMENARPKRCDLARIGYAATHLIAFFGADFPVDTWKRKHSRDYRTHRQGQGVTDSTIRRELGVLSAAFGHAVEEERIDALPVVKLPPEGRPRERWFTEEEVQRIFEQPMDAPTRIFMYLALGTGARETAIRTLPWGRVDFAAKFIDFRDPALPITKKKRVKLVLADFLFPVLQSAYQEAKAAGNAGPDDLVIGVERESMWPYVKRALRGAGIDEKGAAAHCFRRTFVMWALLNGASYAEVGAATGDSPTMLEKSYSKFFPEHTSRAVSAVQLPKGMSHAG